MKLHRFYVSLVQICTCLEVYWHDFCVLCPCNSKLKSALDLDVCARKFSPRARINISRPKKGCFRFFPTQLFIIQKILKDSEPIIVLFYLARI